MAKGEVHTGSGEWQLKSVLETEYVSMCLFRTPDLRPRRRMRCTPGSGEWVVGLGASFPGFGGSQLGV